MSAFMPFDSRRRCWSGGIQVLMDEDPLDYCLTCGAIIRSSFEWEMNNGNCNQCGRLTRISGEFWRVLSAKAARGDWEAQETFRRYGDPAPS